MIINELKYSATRFSTDAEALVFSNFHKNEWSFFVRDNGSEKAPSRVGPIYATKTELLADLPRYAASYGYAV